MGMTRLSRRFRDWDLGFGALASKPCQIYYHGKIEKTRQTRAN